MGSGVRDHGQLRMRSDSSACISLLLVDDDAILRLGLRTVFERTGDTEVIGEAGSVSEAVDAASRLAPHVVLMDMRLPDGTGAEACREILALRPETRVLFLTAYDDEEMLVSAVLAGAHGVLLKGIDGENLRAAVRGVAAGDSVLDPVAARAVAERMERLAAFGANERAAESLSPQEKRVLALVADGKTNKEIALVLELSDKTVKNYLSTIFEKLHVHRRALAAVVFRKSNPE
jgi:two-component system, NarL family, response regulator DevR